MEDFVSEVETFLTRTGMKPSTFGWDAFKDPNFVFDLRNKGRCPNLEVVDRARKFMAQVEQDRETPQAERASA